MMERKFRLGKSSPLLLLFGSLVPVNGDEQIGYYVPSGAESARVASCDYQTTLSHRWSSVGSIGVCVETEAESGSDVMTTGYYLGESCNGPSAFGHYLAIADDGRSATVTVSFPCDRSCATIIVFSASPSVLPSVSFIGCPEQLGLPPEARTVYAELPSGITAATGSKSVTSSPSRSSSSTSTASMTSTSTSTSSPLPQTTASNTRNETSEGPTSGSTDGNSKTSVIVGAVVGLVGGIALIVLAWFLGRRHAAKKRPLDTIPNTAHEPHEPHEPPYGKVEMDGTRPGAPGANDAAQQQVAWNQAAWDVQQQPIVAQVSQPPVSELASNYPAAHQLSAGRGPYEFPEVPGSYKYNY